MGRSAVANLGLAALILALGTLLPSEATARKKKARPAQKVALFPFVLEDNPNAKLVGTVSTLLEKASSHIEQIELRSGKRLRRLLRRDPGKTIAKCGADLPCIAAWGNKAKADEVLLARASPEGKGVKVRFVFVNVKTKTVDRKLSLVFTDTNDVKRVLGEQIYALYALTDPGSLTLAGNIGPVNIDGEIVGTGVGPFSLAPGRHEILASGQTHTLVIAPNQQRTLEIEAPATESDLPPLASLPLEAPPETSDKTSKQGTVDESTAETTVDDGDLQLVAITPTTVPTVNTGEPSTAGNSVLSSVLWYGGLGLAGAGVAVFGVGGYYGRRAETLRKQDRTKTQIDLIDRQQPAQNRAASRANLLMGVGGALIAVGSAALILDTFAAEPAVSVDVDGSAASLGVNLRW